MLTLIAYRFSIDAILPQASYMTRMDFFILGATFLVFLTLVQAGLTSNLHRGGREELAQRIDKVRRFVFPAVFFLCSLSVLFL